jgi:spermidine dehydrogenase
MNLEYLSFTDTVLEFLAELGIDVQQLSKELDFHYGGDQPAIWFDADTFGSDVLVPGFSMYSRNLTVLDRIGRFPISESGRVALKQFYSSEANVLQGMSEAEIDHVLRRTSYTDFLSQYAGLPGEVVDLFVKSTDGYWGVQPHSLSTTEALNAWLPGSHLLGNASDRAAGLEESEKVAMFPDGNASIARLLVQSLIRGVAPGAHAENIAVVRFNYDELDRPGNFIRLRLEATAVHVVNEAGRVAVTYVKDGLNTRVRGKHCVLACYHAMIPHLCPDIPEKQQEAARYQVKHPMLVTNVLVRSGKPFEELGITGAYCPGRMHAKVWLIKGVNTAGYQGGRDVQGPVPVMFWGMVAPPRSDVSIHEQLRQSRQIMLEMTFEDYEREVRTVLDGMLGPAGFNAAEDILAITVNRWPHGYAYGYLDLWDPEWEAGQAPHEIARQSVGNIAIANSDAAASAYTQSAIEEAMRAIDELG